MTSVTPPGGTGLGRFNLSEWALHHRPMVLYLIVLFAVMGALAYTRLGQSEDPPYTFKVMVVKTLWPGASARDVEQQVTDRIERKLQELPHQYVRSYSRPGESLVFIAYRDSLTSKQIPELQYQTRKKVGDIRNQLPAGSVLRMSPIFLRTWYWSSGTAEDGVESLNDTNTSDSPGFE